MHYFGHARQTLLTYCNCSTVKKACSFTTLDHYTTVPCGYRQLLISSNLNCYFSHCKLQIMCVPTRTYLTFNNDKPWFSTKLKQLRLAKEDAYRSGEKALYKQAKYTLNREIRVAKKNYTEKLKKQLSSNDSTSVWKGLKAVTSYKTPPPSTEANQQLTEDLNNFYCRAPFTLHVGPGKLPENCRSAFCVNANTSWD